jgi:nicotinamidase/pyrazinamidase
MEAGSGLQLRRGDGLLLVDVQRDFLPGGALAVAGGDGVVEPLNRCLALFASLALPVYATRDWHPPHHMSFVTEGGPWPVHCVAGTPGAAFAPTLRLPPTTVVVSKAQQREREAYSGFSGTDLAQQLRHARVLRLFIGGLATDYCVLRTALDARWLGFEVMVLRDAIAAVDAQAGDGDRAVEQMRHAGASFVDSDQLLAPPAAQPGL